MGFNVVIDETVGRAMLLNKRRAFEMCCWCLSFSAERVAGFNVIRDLCLASSLNTKPQAFALPQQIPVQSSGSISTWGAENRHQSWAAE